MALDATRRPASPSADLPAHRHSASGSRPAASAAVDLRALLQRSAGGEPRSRPGRGSIPSSRARAARARRLPRYRPRGRAAPRPAGRHQGHHRHRRHPDRERHAHRRWSGAADRCYRRRAAEGRRRHRPRQDGDHRARLHAPGRDANPATPATRPAAPPPVRLRPSPRAWSPSPSAPRPQARSSAPPPSAASSGTSRASGRSRAPASCRSRRPRHRRRLRPQRRGRRASRRCARWLRPRRSRDRPPCPAGPARNSDVPAAAASGVRLAPAARLGRRRSRDAGRPRGARGLPWRALHRGAASGRPSRRRRGPRPHQPRRDGVELCRLRGAGRRPPLGRNPRRDGAWPRDRCAATTSPPSLCARVRSPPSTKSSRASTRSSFPPRRGRLPRAWLDRRSDLQRPLDAHRCAGRDPAAAALRRRPAHGRPAHRPARGRRAPAAYR